MVTHDWHTGGRGHDDTCVNYSHQHNINHYTIPLLSVDNFANTSSLFFDDLSASYMFQLIYWLKCFRCDSTFCLILLQILPTLEKSTEINTTCGCCGFKKEKLLLCIAYNVKPYLKSPRWCCTKDCVFLILVSSSLIPVGIALPPDDGHAISIVLIIWSVLSCSNLYEKQVTSKVFEYTYFTA